MASTFVPTKQGFDELGSNNENQVVKEVVTNKPFLKEGDVSLRYSDEDLAEFKQIILDKIAKTQGELEVIKSAYSVTSENGTDDTAVSNKESDENAVYKKFNSELVARQEKLILDLKQALHRVENKTYGICRKTNQLIGKERLKIVPHATLSMQAKNAEKKFA